MSFESYGFDHGFSAIPKALASTDCEDHQSSVDPNQAEPEADKRLCLALCLPLHVESRDMRRVILILLSIFFANDCASMEISRIAGCAGDMLRLRGAVDDGDYARFRSYFGAERRIVGLDISSEGGSLNEGFQIAHLTRQKRLFTYVSKECNSVCAFIFLASRRRFVSPSAKVGVHSVSNPHGGEDLRTLRDTVQLARLSAKLGIPPSTIGKMVATPPRKISYLDRGELLALKVIFRDPFAPVADEKSRSKYCGPDGRKEAPVSDQPPPKTAEFKPSN